MIFISFLNVIHVFQINLNMRNLKKKSIHTTAVVEFLKWSAKVTEHYLPQHRLLNLRVTAVHHSTPCDLRKQPGLCSQNDPLSRMAEHKSLSTPCSVQHFFNDDRIMT